MKQLFDEVSLATSRITTKRYSTSFSMGITMLSKPMRGPIYSIYGFVRLADEIVDSFHDFEQGALLEEFRKDTELAIERGISLNPVLNSFQRVVREYGIEKELIDLFMDSMAMDLEKVEYDRDYYQKYILGSAEAVGLMCLRVFCEGDDKLFKDLKHPAQMLGSAFQKVNFLRDARQDFHELGRTYFPNVDLSNFGPEEKAKIEAEIDEEFRVAREGIKKLPESSRRGVYLAYIYYRKLFDKITRVAPEDVMSARIRISNGRKLGLLVRMAVTPSTRLSA